MQKMSSMSLSGLVLSFMGVIAIAFPLFSTVAIDALIGTIFLVGGIFHVIAVLDEKDDRDLIWNVFIGFAFLITGTLMISHTVTAGAAVTFLLMTFFAVQGIATLGSAFNLRGKNDKWWWTLLSSMCSLLIAYLIWVDFPQSGAWAVGTLAGIYLVLFGVALLARGGSFGQK